MRINTMCAWLYIITLSTPLCSIIDSNVVAGILFCLDGVAEDRTPPGPGAVRDNVGQRGVECSGMCVELAGFVRRTVVVRVTDR